MFFASLAKLGNFKTIWVKLFFFILMLTMGLHFNQAFKDYTDQSAQSAEEGSLVEAPSMIPVTGKGIGAGLAVLAFLVSLWIRKKQSPPRRHTLFIVALWLLAIGAILAVLPSDYMSTRAAIEGKALAGETHSIPAYIGQLVFLGFLLVSPPLMAQFYYRLGLMDQYVVKAFLTPFSFCLIAIFSIWLIVDFDDNGGDFGDFYGMMGQFYLVQIPSMILFVLPICILLALLFSLSNLSKANEFISMIGAGRSVLRIISPLLIVGFYFSLVAMALKYEWGPSAAGLSESILKSAKVEVQKKKQLEASAGKNKKAPKPVTKLWSQTGWMHVNEFANRTWFVGYVPLKLSEPLRNVLIFETTDKVQLSQVWQASVARWDWREDEKTWNLVNGKVYKYNEPGVPEKVPVIRKFDRIALEGWNETPWKVLSSSQNPEHLGLSGLTMFLEANQEMTEFELAKFRTHRWNLFAEPFTCFIMALMAAPLGIVYGRKGIFGGFIAAIIIFALMYILNGTTMALGQRNDIPPFWGAWTCNLIVAALGIGLIWFRSRNRDTPKFKTIISLGLIR